MTLIRVIDTETTGMAPPEAVCELGWTDIRDGTIAGPIDVLVNPGRPIPPEVSAIHHLIDEDVAGGLTWADAVRDMMHGNRPAALAAHNARFDRQWLTPDLTGDIPWICTYKCSLRLWPDAPAHGNQVLRYWRKPVGLPRNVGDTHRAGPDTLVTAYLLRDMLTLANLEDLIRWTAEPALLPRCRIGKYSADGKGTPWSQVETGYMQWLLTKEFDEDVKHSARVELDRRKSAV